MGIHLVTGSDDVLVGRAVADLVHRLVGDADRSLVLEEFDPSLDEFDLHRVVDAAQTLPFLSDHRVVVLRDIGAMKAEQLEGLDHLVTYLADPAETTELVLVASGGRPPKKLVDAAKSAGAQVLETGAPSANKQRNEWMRRQLAAAPVRFDERAQAAVIDWVGEDVGRIVGLFETLVGVYGPGAKVGVPEATPFMGEAAGVPPWELTDAIDAGDTTKALRLLHRMLHGGDRHPLQILATLHGHYQRALRLDGSGARSGADASAIIGVKGFAADKALNLQRRLGSTGVARAMELLAQADVDLKGDKDWPPELVAEVLVARLSRLSPVSSKR
jgi:DNA polymerase III subunit delta